MKVLFISDYLLTPYGGAQKSAIAHLESLRRIVGYKNIDVAAIKYDSEEKNEYFYLPNSIGRKQSVINALHGNTFLVSDALNKMVFNLIDSREYNILFLDNSWFGKIAKYSKKKYPQIKIITNFHGVKANSRQQYLKKNPINPFMYTDFIMSLKNEKDIVKYSDKLLLLNNRESNMLKKYYNRNADLILPVYFVDTANITKVIDDGVYHILFVGGALPANIKGIQWFIKNVMPKLQGNLCLDVVGNSMERLKKIPNIDKRINVIGRVDALDKYYNNANLAIGPIFEGDGMKTKTAEALMYGKYFVGTDEALCGYEGLNDYRCNSACEFIDKINNMIQKHTPKYSVEMRKIFDNNHSVAMADRVFRTALELQ